MKEHTYSGAVRELESVSQFVSTSPKYTYGIQRMRKFLDYIGHLEDSFKFIQIAGTNGKGSTAAYLSEIFIKKGLKTGIFTSPHLIDIRERIKIGDEMISRKDFARLFYLVKEIEEEIKKKEAAFTLAYFDILLAIACIYFKENGVEVAVMETGLGGRKDAVTALKSPAGCVITSIGIDHEGILGTTIKEQAREKAGIIRDGAGVIFMAENQGSDVIEKKAEECGLKICKPSKKNIKILSKRDEQIDFTIESSYYSGVTFTLASRALYQVENAYLAMEVYRFICGSPVISSDDVNTIKKALLSVKIRARMQKIADDIYIDGCHNPQGVERFLETAGEITEGRSAVLLFSAVNDKNFSKMIEKIIKKRIFSHIIITEVKISERALKAEELQEVFDRFKGRYSFEMEIITTVSEAIKRCEDLQEKEGGKVDKPLVFIAGSLFLAAEAEAYFNNRHVIKKGDI